MLGRRGSGHGGSGQKGGGAGNTRVTGIHMGRRKKRGMGRLIGGGMM